MAGQNQRQHRDQKTPLYSEIASLHMTIADIFQRMAASKRKAQHHVELISLQKNMTGILERLTVMAVEDEKDNEDEKEYGEKDDSDVDDDDEEEEYYTADGGE